MIKNSLRIFFKNFIYVFVAMGLVYLFMTLTVIVFVSSAISSTGTLIKDVISLVQTSVETSGNEIVEFFTYAVEKIDTSGNVFDILYRVFDTHWISDTITGFFETLNISVEGFSSELNVMIAKYVSDIKQAVSVAVTLLIIGIVSASYATRFVLRRKNAKRNIKKFLIARYAEPLLLSGIVLLSLFIFSALKSYAVLVYIALAALLSVLSLASSWLIHRDKNMKFKEIVNTKNILLYAASAFIILLLDIAFTAAVFFINPLISILVAVPLLIYSLNVIGVNSDSFVCETIANRKPAEKAEEYETEQAEETTKTE